MKALLRPLLVGGLSIAIAATSLLGSSSVAFAATRPTFVSLTVPAFVDEGDKPTVTGTFTDPDMTDQHTVQIGWGDGSADFYILAVGDRSFSLQKSVGYADDQPGGTSDTLMLQVTLGDGLSSVNRFPSITVNNVAPTVTDFTLSSAEIDAGQAVAATGTFADVGVVDTHPVTINWGDGTPNTTLNLARRVWTFTTPEHTFAAGTYTVTATIADDDGGSVEATANVTVNGVNQPPSVVSFGVAAGTEGGNSNLALSFADADASDTHTVSVAWGDGSTSEPVPLEASVTTYSTTHAYADNGTYQVVLTLEDSALNSVTADASVSPTNVAPTVGGLTVSPASVVDHQTLTVSGDFTDPGTADTFSVTVDWGDESSSSPTLAAGTRSFSASHDYAAEGTYVVTATVTDRDGDSGSQTASVIVTASVGGSVSELLDELSMLITTFDLHWHTERWLVRRIDELKASLSAGNTEVCRDLEMLGKVSTFASRRLSSDQYAELTALVAKIAAAAECSGTPVVTPKPLGWMSTDKNKADPQGKQEKDKSDKSEKQDEKSQRNATNRKAGHH